MRRWRVLPWLVAVSVAAVWLVAARPDSPGPHHFWHDRAQRPTTYPFQRGDDPAAVATFLAYVTGATGTTWP